MYIVPNVFFDDVRLLAFSVSWLQGLTAFQGINVRTTRFHRFMNDALHCSQLLLWGLWEQRLGLSCGYVFFLQHFQNTRRSAASTVEYGLNPPREYVGTSWKPLATFVEQEQLKQTQNVGWAAKRACLVSMKTTRTLFSFRFGNYFVSERYVQ